MRRKTTILEVGKWYTDARGGSFTSFLKYAGFYEAQAGDVSLFSGMRGHMSPYPLINGHYHFIIRDDMEWFIPSKEDVEKWDLH